MNVREGELIWTKKEMVKSVLLFTLNFVVILLLVGLRLFWVNAGNFFTAWGNLGSGK